MRVLFDVNILLDVLLNRSPWVTDSSSVWALNDQKRIEGYVAASTFTDIFYIARRIKDIPTAFQSIRICIDAFDICSVEQSTIALASNLPDNDFEDNVLIACAALSHMDAIVTRNTADFRNASTAVYTPTALLDLFQGEQDAKES